MLRAVENRSRHKKCQREGENRLDISHSGMPVGQEYKTWELMSQKKKNSPSLKLIHGTFTNFVWFCAHLPCVGCMWYLPQSHVWSVALFGPRVEIYHGGHLCRQPHIFSPAYIFHSRALPLILLLLYRKLGRCAKPDSSGTLVNPKSIWDHVTRAVNKIHEPKVSLFGHWHKSRIWGRKGITVSPGLA